MTDPTALKTYTFAVLYKNDAIEVVVEAKQEAEAMRFLFENTADVRAGWTMIMPCFQTTLASSKDVHRGTMVAAAARRAFVQMADGRIGRLVRWDTPKRPKTARIEVKPGIHLTFKCDQITAVDLPQPKEVTG